MMYESIYHEKDHGPQRFGPRRLFKGGGGSSTTVQSIPEELKPLATAYADKAMDLSSQGYSPYYGQRYANLTGSQQAGIGMIQNRALGGSATMDNAENSLNGFIQGGNSNPYLDQMVGKAQSQVKNNFMNSAISSGSFGNSGLQQQYGQGMADIASQMYGNAYNTDQANRLSALQLAPTYGNRAYTDAQQLLNAGQLQQDTTQRNLDYGYQQYQDAQNLPYKQLAAMSGVFGSNLGGTSTTTQSGGGK